MYLSSWTQASPLQSDFMETSCTLTVYLEVVHHIMIPHCHLLAKMKSRMQNVNTTETYWDSWGAVISFWSWQSEMRGDSRGLNNKTLWQGRTLWGRSLLRSDTETQKITTDAIPQLNIMPSAKQCHLTTTGNISLFFISRYIYMYYLYIYIYFCFFIFPILLTFSFGNIEL